MGNAAITEELGESLAPSQVSHMPMPTSPSRAQGMAVVDWQGWLRCLQGRLGPAGPSSEAGAPSSATQGLMAPCTALSPQGTTDSPCFLFVLPQKLPPSLLFKSLYTQPFLESRWNNVQLFGTPTLLLFFFPILLPFSLILPFFLSPFLFSPFHQTSASFHSVSGTMLGVRCTKS